MNEPLASLDGYFTSPQSCLVEVTETIHHNWYGKGDGEDTKESANATDKLAKSRDGRGGAYDETNMMYLGKNSVP